MKRKILITGVAGFIGSNLSRYLIKRATDQEGGEISEIIGIDNLSSGRRENIPDKVAFYCLDIRSPEIYPLFQGVDVVFHLAAKNCLYDCLKNPVETADINVVGTINVFEACRRNKVRKIVYAESSALYEGSKVFPTPETEVRPLSFYSVSKNAAMLFAQAYNRFYDVNFTALRYFCVYGPSQDYNRTIPPVMSAFIIKLLKGEAPVIYGSGKKRRDFIYIDDVNDFHWLCIFDPRTDNRSFNLGSGRNYSVLEIYEEVVALLGIRIAPLFLPDLPGEAEDTLADISLARSLGWEPKTGLKEGLKKEIDYLRKEIEKGSIETRKNGK